MSEETDISPEESYLIGEESISESPTAASLTPTSSSTRFNSFFNGRSKSSMNARVVSLDSSSYKSASEKYSPKRGKNKSALRSLSSSAVIESKPFEKNVMVPLNFDKVHDDTAHPLSSLRSCSEFGLHGVDGVVKDPQNTPKRYLLIISRRTCGFYFPFIKQS